MLLHTQNSAGFLNKTPCLFLPRGNVRGITRRAATRPIRISENSHFAHTSLSPRSLCLRSNCARRATDGNKIGNSPSISCETQSSCFRLGFVRGRGLGNNARYRLRLGFLTSDEGVKSEIEPTSAQAPGGRKVVIGVSSRALPCSDSLPSPWFGLVNLAACRREISIPIGAGVMGRRTR
jgi:hypothetical protein